MKTGLQTISNRLRFAIPPVQPWPNPLFARHGIQVDVLRLDAVHPVAGGNKWMKLRSFLQQALDQKKAGVLTKGGPWSNHIHAAAFICQQLGVPLYVWVKGNASSLTAMLQDVTAWGAHLQFVNRGQFYDEKAAYHFATENNLLYIPMGGADAEGISSTTDFINHLPLPVYDYAVCAIGTATTFGGLAFTANNFPKVIGIEVGTNDAEVTTKVQAWQQQLPAKHLQLVVGYEFGGFARHPPQLVQFANELYAITGIPTDMVYTAKLFYAVQDLAIQGYFPPGSKLLLVHSGGLQGNRSLPIGTLQF
jgi:1-aminocyclopropane-1-carboxylate deaminase